MAKRPKPAKPYPEFPLRPHANGLWCKKIRGKLFYFGPWRDPDAALAKYLDQRDELHAGRTPRVRGEGLTVAGAVNQFLAVKEAARDAGELQPSTFDNYWDAGKALAAHFGRTTRVADLSPEDFQGLRAELGKGKAPATLALAICQTRCMFKWAYDQGLIDAPVRYGQGFTKPAQKVLRQARHDAGPRMFEAAEIRKLLKAADQPLQAMIYLGINAAFGPTDCARLPEKALDLDGGWVTFPRPKTAIERRVPLWPETVASIRESLAGRSDPVGASAKGLVFLTHRGHSWEGERVPGVQVTNAFTALAKETGLYRKGRGFYGLRRSFETIGGDSLDQVAVDALMGHAPASGDMGAVYRQRISDDRLKAVVEHVRRWVFENSEKE